MPALRRPTLLVRLALIVLPAVTAACGTATAPTPVPIVAEQVTVPASAPAETSAPSPSVSPRPRPATGFFFAAEQVIAYYAEGAGFECDGWAPADVVGHQQRACVLEGEERPVDEVVIVTVDEHAAIADVVAIYEHRDGSAVDRGAAMRFFATVVGSTFGGDDGEAAATWLGANLGAERATTQLRGLTLDTSRPTPVAGPASQLLIEIATSAYLAAA